ncbi:MAG: DUF416 family protein [Deltaproteobacteria bacterium]|nr:DUF416 family protein [Deltaproteobacteria bacterium]
MALDFDEEALVRALDACPPLARAVFAAACVERLRRAYVSFARASGLVDGERRFVQLLDDLWRALERPLDVSVERRKAAVDAAIALIPDADDELYDPYAEDAAAALLYAWECLATGESQPAAWAARRSHEAVDQLVIRPPSVEIGDPAAEARILAHPLIQAALERQRADLVDLRSFDDSAAARVRGRAERTCALRS